MEWKIEYPEKIIDGRVVFSEQTIKVAAIDEETVVSINIACGINLPVLARPIFKINEKTEKFTGGYTAGAVYPADIEGRNLILNWEDGFACEILKSCLLNSDTVTAFDTIRFRASLIEKAGEFEDSKGGKLPGGCWLIDSVPVLSRMGYGLFRESSIKSAQTMQFCIPVVGGSYQADNTLYPLTNTIQDNGKSFLNVLIPINRRTIFYSNISSEVIEVFFNEGRWCWANLLTGASESGRM